MKNNAHDRMRDPFYAPLLLQIESAICWTDNEAKEAGLDLSDSQVRSALVKVRKLVQGHDPKIPQETERDQILWQLIMALWHAPDNLMEEGVGPGGEKTREPLELAHWDTALETVLSSMKIHQVDAPGSRAYLDFVREFIAGAQGPE